MFFEVHTIAVCLLNLKYAPNSYNLYNQVFLQKIRTKFVHLETKHNLEVNYKEIAKISYRSIFALNISNIKVLYPKTDWFHILIVCDVLVKDQ